MPHNNVFFEDIFSVLSIDRLIKIVVQTNVIFN